MKNENIKQRKDFVDYIKALGIILVVLGHINFTNQEIKTWIYAFHMPLFFCSGINDKENKGHYESFC